MKDLPASHPLYGSEQSKSGFGICYQFAIKCPVSVSKTQYFQGFAGFVSYSHSTNPIIWGCISYTLTGITFANLLIFYLLFLAANFLSIKIVSQKAGEYNYLLHRFPGYSAIENTLIYRKFSFIALDAFRSGRSRHPWTL